MWSIGRSSPPVLLDSINFNLIVKMQTVQRIIVSVLRGLTRIESSPSRAK